MMTADSLEMLGVVFQYLPRMPLKRRAKRLRLVRELLWEPVVTLPRMDAHSSAFDVLLRFRRDLVASDHRCIRK